jgi:hypothetical protein
MTSGLPTLYCNSQTWSIYALKTLTAKLATSDRGVTLGLNRPNKTQEGKNSAGLQLGPNTLCARLCGPSPGLSRQIVDGWTEFAPDIFCFFYALV